MFGNKLQRLKFVGVTREESDFGDGVLCGVLVVCRAERTRLTSDSECGQSSEFVKDLNHKHLEPGLNEDNIAHPHRFRNMAQTGKFISC